MKHKVQLVRDDEDWNQTQYIALDLTVKKIVQYLEKDPRNAVLLPTERKYVLRGAGEDLRNFYWGDLPAEDPNDAEGGDLTAEEAVRAALEASVPF